MTTFTQRPARVALGGQVVALSGDELGRLLRALAGLDLRDAEAVGEQIAALRLAGGTIELTPTEAELAALRLALGGLADGTEEISPALLSLAAICAEGELGEALRRG